MSIQNVLQPPESSESETMPKVYVFINSRHDSTYGVTVWLM